MLAWLEFQCVCVCEWECPGDTDLYPGRPQSLHIPVHIAVIRKVGTPRTCQLPTFGMAHPSQRKRLLLLKHQVKYGFGFSNSHFECSRFHLLRKSKVQVHFARTFRFARFYDEACPFPNGFYFPYIIWTWDMHTSNIRFMLSVQSQTWVSRVTADLRSDYTNVHLLAIPAIALGEKKKRKSIAVCDGGFEAQQSRAKIWPIINVCVCCNWRE